MIDFDKFIKYSKPGPRYTSYPTAVEFHENFKEADFAKYLTASNNTTKPLSLYFHLPFCRSACYFCGCNVVYTSKDDKKTRYIGYLKKELEILSKYLNTDRLVTQLHFGGGTPTFFSTAELKEIIGEIKKYFKNFDKDAEISCEIDPRFFNEEQMAVMASEGFNRVSFGIQDFDETVQKTVHRVQSYEETKNAVLLARKYGIKSINADLIYGLPHQTFESFRDTLKKAVELDIERFAVFNYAHVPWLKKTMRKLDETKIPSPAVKLQIMEYVIEYMTQSGFNMIGMDHFAKPDDELSLAEAKGELHRNFQGYTTKGGSDMIGVGLTSISELDGCYSQNYKEMDDYERCIDSGLLPVHRGIELTEDDKIRKETIMELMGSFRLVFSQIEQKFGIDFKEYFKDSLSALKEFEAEGLVSVDTDKIVVNETGKLLIRNISMPFDGYIQIGSEQKNKFSKTI